MAGPSRIQELLREVRRLTSTPMVTRNCYRCGVEFTGAPRERVCPNCHKTLRGSASFRGQDTYQLPLSFRERQVIKLIADGKSNKDIAHTLHLAEGTIKEYINRIFHKTGADNRTTLAVMFIKGEM